MVSPGDIPQAWFGFTHQNECEKAEGSSGARLLA